MNQVNVSLYCCPMRIDKVRSDLRLTELEPMVATITGGGVAGDELERRWQKANTVEINPVIIPRTYVRRLGMLHWQVDACTGHGRNFDGWVLVVELPVEPVVFRLSAFTMVDWAIRHAACAAVYSPSFRPPRPAVPIPMGTLSRVRERASLPRALRLRHRRMSRRCDLLCRYLLRTRPILNPLRQSWLGGIPWGRPSWRAFSMPS